MSLSQNQIIIIVVVGSLFISLIVWGVYKYTSSSSSISSEPSTSLNMEMQPPSGITGGKGWRKLRRRFHRSKK